MEVRGTTTVEGVCPCCGKEITIDDVEVTIEVDLSDFAPDQGWRD